VIKYVSRNSTVGEHGTTWGDAKRQVSEPTSSNGTVQGRRTVDHPGPRRDRQRSTRRRWRSGQAPADHWRARTEQAGEVTKPADSSELPTRKADLNTVHKWIRARVEHALPPQLDAVVTRFTSYPHDDRQIDPGRQLQRGGQVPQIVQSTPR
jgi:hypothetical protein